MNAEMILVKTDDVLRLEDLLSTWKMKDDEASLAMPGFPSRYEKSRSGKKRTLFVIAQVTEWVALLEGGGYADEFVSRRLSHELQTESVVVGVFETSNSWAVRKYSSGKVVEQRFEPESAFAEGITGPEEELEGDATEICREWLLKNGWPHSVLLFQDVLNREISPELSGAEIRRITVPRQ